MTMAPASRMREIACPDVVAVRRSGGKPLVDGRPGTSMLSLIAHGTPHSGARRSPVPTIRSQRDSASWRGTRWIQT